MGSQLAGTRDRNPSHSLDYESGKTGDTSKKVLRMIGRTKSKYAVMAMVFIVNNLISSQCIKSTPNNNDKLQKRLKLIVNNKSIL